MSLSYSGSHAHKAETERKSLQDIERSIVKTYRKDIWSKFVKGVKEFEMIDDGDKIAVGISGGKDSLLLAKLLQEYQKYGGVSFELEFLAMNPGYYEVNVSRLKENCAYLNIPIVFYDAGIFDIVDESGTDYPCFLCAKMRRGALYSKAKALGCNKLALGHHMDDVIETQLMNIFYAGATRTMMPKIKAKNFEDMTLLRPMYFLKEKDVLRFMKNAGLQPLDCGCEVAAGNVSTKRQAMKRLIAKLREETPEVDKNILSAANNVEMDCIVGWVDHEGHHSFLERY